MATESSVGVTNQTGATSLPIDTVQVTPLGGVVQYRQTITLADPNAAGAFAAVDAVAGLSVNTAQDTRQLLTAILSVLHSINVQLGGLPTTNYGVIDGH